MLFGQLCARTEMHISDHQKMSKLQLQHTSHTMLLESSIITVSQWTGIL